MDKFLKYLNETLPIGYWAEKDNYKVIIKNQTGYIYMFYQQEIEEDFETCCSLVQTLLEIA